MSRPGPSTPPPPSPGPPAVPIESCPIAATLGTLGRKWTINILRDIAFFPNSSFSFIRKRNPGLLPRTLSLRLRQLAEGNLVVRSVGLSAGARPTYQLTEKGQQVWPILATLMQFGVQNHADQVFRDGRARNLEDIYPTGEGILLGRFARPSAQRNRPRPAIPARS